MNREAFLLHLAKQLGRPEIRNPPKREQIGAPDHWKSFVLPRKSERVDRFCQEARTLGAEVHCFETQQQLQEGLQALLTSLKPQSILRWDHTECPAMIDSVLNRWKSRIVDPIADPSQALHADVGITTVDFAIADTGTLVLCSDEQKSRGVSLFPAHHIAIVDADQIRTRMGEVLAEFRGGKPPSAIHFITGPSRSSDIENDLSIGVHGPAVLHILVKV